MTDPQLTNNNRNSSSSSISSSSSSSSSGSSGSSSSSNSNNSNNNNNSGISNNSIINHNIINNNSNINNNNNNSNNHNSKNNYEEPKYLHKKFKKIATSEDVGTVVTTSASHVTMLKTKDNLSDLDSTNTNEVGESRKSGYICPYCKLSCAKPSVLQKHIRAHTNERPYPCRRCGFAFKTKSNLYKHCRSRAHAVKMEGADITKVLQTALQLSEDSDVSLSDSASNDTSTPPPLLPPLPPPLVIPSSLTHSPIVSNLSLSQKTVKIYKPKFHMALQQCAVNEINSNSKINLIQEHIESAIADNRTITEALNPHLHELLRCQQNSTIPEAHRKRCHELNMEKQFYSENKSEVEFEHKHKPKSELDSESESDYYVNQQSLPSPGPVLGHTQLVDVRKRPRLEEFSRYSRPSALQMFGGEVRILDRTGESKTLRIEPCSSGSPNTTMTGLGPVSGSETASIVVRSSLHSGGTMLQKPVIEKLSVPRNSDHLGLVTLAPNISPPSLAPSLGILQTSEIHSFSSRLPESDKEATRVTVCAPPFGNKFLRPSSLPLKLGSFTPKCYNGVTPITNTLTLVSPETPRPKKSYGQLYLNGHAYTYLGLKCSTRLFYCTLNRPQPMYVTQQHGLSMYSNWKICKEAPPELELARYDSRHRPAGYTLASGRHEDILTHSSQRPCAPNSPDSGLESDSQERARRLRLFDSSFEINEDYTHINSKSDGEIQQRSRTLMGVSPTIIAGRGRYICEECGIHCKKPSMLKKHIRTHTNLRPYRCTLCAFSFKTKGNLTKHMKSKAHRKKCIESRILYTKETTGAQYQNSTDDSSTSEEESEFEAEAESEESGGEEREAARGLLSLARPVALQLPGLLSTDRPATYPYGRVALSHRSEEPAAPIDLTTRQPEEPVMELASLASVAERASLVAELPGRGAGSSTLRLLSGLDVVPRRVVVGGPAFQVTTSSAIGVPNFASISEDARSVCGICSKVFSKPSQLRLHINIHYFERPFRCESCGTSFRTKGHLTKHERSTLHHNKVSMTSTFGAATASNPRPFKCTDCKSAFRIHGHLAKHLRSKMHIMKLECLRKLPFGTYAEIERSSVNLNDIDTNDCDTSLTSLQIIAQKLFEKDPSKLEQWEIRMLPVISGGDSSSDEDETNPVHSTSQQCTETHLSQNCYMTKCTQSSDINLAEIKLDEARKSSIYKCHLCPTSVQNLSELHVHCFVEHNIESNNSSIINSLTNIKDKIK